MTSLLFRKNINQSKYSDLIERCLNSIPEICEDLRNDFGDLHNMPELSHEHLMSAHAAGCVGKFNGIIYMYLMLCDDLSLAGFDRNSKCNRTEKLFEYYLVSKWRTSNWSHSTKGINTQILYPAYAISDWDGTKLQGFSNFCKLQGFDQ